MGHNLDLKELLGLPEQMKCPHCETSIPTHFDDYDIDCGDTRAIDGTLTLTVYCEDCDKTFEVKTKTSWKSIQ